MKIIEKFKDKIKGILNDFGKNMQAKQTLFDEFIVIVKKV